MTRKKKIIIVIVLLVVMAVVYFYLFATPAAAKDSSKPDLGTGGTGGDNAKSPSGGTNNTENSFGISKGAGEGVYTGEGNDGYGYIIQNGLKFSIAPPTKDGIGYFKNKPKLTK